MQKPDSCRPFALYLNNVWPREVELVRQFGANLLGVIDLPVAFWDERFSTIGAERPLREAEMSHRRRADVIDKLAAAYILQGALDRLANLGPPA